MRKLGEYAAVLAAPASTLAVMDPSAATALAALSLKGVGWLGRLLKLRTSDLPGLKSEIATGLRRLESQRPGLRLVLIIDDADRLEPIEAVEMLRLIKHAADFPLVVYVVCYDESVLSRQIEDVLRISNPRGYLEKVFQTTVSIPPHEPFALRRYATKLFASTYPKEMAAARLTENSGYRQTVVLDYWAGALLKTPRDVVRWLEAVKFGWRWLPVGADFLDFVWLQLVKLKAPKLYRWVQLYLTNVAAYRDGGRPTDGDDKELGLQLNKIMRKLGWGSSAAFLSGIDRILPGVSSFALEGDRRKVFQFSHNELSRFEQAGRLGSPTHWRNYFAFSFPTYAVTDEELSAFRQRAAANDGAAAQMLLTLSEKPHQRRGHFVDVLLDRLDDLPAGAFTSDELAGMANAFAAVMDTVAARAKTTDDFGGNVVWTKALNLLKRTQPEAFQQMVEAGSSVNWFADVIRDQGLAHGLPDAARMDRERQWLSRQQFDDAIKAFVVRVEGISTAEVFAMPEPLAVLFCWAQLGPEPKLRAYLEAGTIEDESFIAAMEAMRGWLSSSDKGVSHPLYREYVAAFMDADAAKNRLSQIANSVSSELSSQAKDLAASWRDQRR
jgi:hypothetical protein